MDIRKYYDPVTKIITMPNTISSIDPKGVGHLVYNSLINNLDLTSQIDANSGATELNSTFLQKCVRAALKMKELGVTSNDVISICSYNDFNSSVPLIASLFLGAKHAALDPSLSLEETAYLINLVKPKLIFVTEISEELICKAVEKIRIPVKIVIFGETRRHIKFSEFLKPNEMEESFEPYAVDDIEETAIILFSSGTSGLPKGICLGHRFFMSHIENTPFSASMVYSTLYWGTNCFATILSLNRGVPRIICKTMDPHLVWIHVEKYKVKSLFLCPSDAVKCFRAIPANYKYPLACLILGGSCVSVDYLKNYKKALPNTSILYMYGQSELFSVFQPTLEESKIGSIGYPMHDRAYKVVDPDTEEVLGFNQKGELRVKTKWCMSGYYKQDSSDCWDADGFIKTGDICYYDEDFCFYIDDRIKEMFKYKSFHIVPAKLEAILLNHPSIEIAAVIGIPHPEEDNHILAVVQVKEGCRLTEDEVVKFVEQQVDDRHRLRGGVKFIKNMPYTPTGKIKRRELRDKFVNGQLDI